MSTTATKEETKQSTDTFPIKGTDYIEFYVGNAKQAAHYYESAWGYDMIAYAGPETGVKDRVSYVLQQGKIRLVLTSAFEPDHEILEHNRKHGDGVKVLALWVDDARKAHELSVERGAKSAGEPKVIEDDHGQVVLSSIHTYGETIHTFVERDEYDGPFMPGYEPRESLVENKPDVGLKYVDHCVGNVGFGKMNEWVQFYQDVLGFKLMITFDDKDISTKYTALMSKVVSSGNEYIKFPINEPAEGLKKSQIEEYLDFYKSAGVQHIAVSTDNIIETVASLRKHGVEFLRIPDNYYEEVPDRVGEIDEDLEDLRKHKILVDRDKDGYLLQIFTKPVQDRPTLFYEIIQRKGARSFGKGNFKALFEAIEREQEARGTL